MWQGHKLSTRLCLVCHFFVLNAFDIICDLFLSRLRVHGLYTSNERRLGSCILLPWFLVEGGDTPNEKQVKQEKQVFTTHLFLPLHPYTSMHILYTVLCTISIGAGKQNFVRLLRTSVVVNHFLYSCDHIQGWYCKEKLDTNHTPGSKGESRCVDLHCGLSLFSFSNEGTLSSLRK